MRVCAYECGKHSESTVSRRAVIFAGQQGLLIGAVMGTHLLMAREKLCTLLMRSTPLGALTRGGWCRSCRSLLGCVALTVFPVCLLGCFSVCNLSPTCSFILQRGTREQCILGPPVVSPFSMHTESTCSSPFVKGNTRTMYARLTLPITLASLNSFGLGWVF